jgi:hypothetical protein
MNDDASRRVTDAGDGRNVTAHGVTVDHTGPAIVAQSCVPTGDSTVRVTRIRRWAF